MIQEIQRDSEVPSWILACRLTRQNTRSSCRPGFGFGWKVWKCAKLAAPPRTEKAQFQTFHLNSLLHNSWMSAVFQSTTCGSFKSPAKVGAGPRAHRHAWEATPSQKDPSGALLCSCWVLFTQNPQEPPVTATGKWGMLKQMGGLRVVERGVFLSSTEERVTMARPRVWLFLLWNSSWWVQSGAQRGGCIEDLGPELHPVDSRSLLLNYR